MNILNIALKDLKQIARDRMSLLFLVIMPLAFTFLMGLLFGGNQQTDNRLNVGLINNDSQGTLTQTLTNLLENSQVVKIVGLIPADEPSISDQINTGKLAGALVIPSNYSTDLLNDKKPQVRIIANPNGTGGQTVLTELQVKISQLLGALETGHLSLQATTAQKPVTDPESYLMNSVSASIQAWQQPSIRVNSEPVSTNANKTGFSGYVQTSPGMLVQFAIGGLIGAASVLVLERKNRTITRLLIAPVTKAQIILGHLLGVTVMVFFQESILILAGQVFFKVNYFQNPGGTLLMMLAVAIFCGSLGLFFGAISKKPEQAIMWPLIAMFLLTALGGAWFPLDITSQAFYTIGHFTPGAWIMDGFQNIILRGLGFSSTLLPALIILIYAGLFFGLAVWRFRFE
jgi:ABC-2 type transport system permease protein